MTQLVFDLNIKYIAYLLKLLLSPGTDIIILGIYLVFIFVVVLHAIYIYKSENAGNNTNNDNNRNNNNNNSSNNNNRNNNATLTPPIYTSRERQVAYDTAKARKSIAPHTESVIREDLAFRSLMHTQDGQRAREILQFVNSARPFHIQKSVLGGQVRNYQLCPNERVYADLGFVNQDTWGFIPNTIISNSRNT